jgi:hypothetical protein
MKELINASRGDVREFLRQREEIARRHSPGAPASP